MRVSSLLVIVVLYYFCDWSKLTKALFKLFVACLVAFIGDVTIVPFWIGVKFSANKTLRANIQFGRAFLRRVVEYFTEGGMDQQNQRQGGEFNQQHLSRIFL